MVSPCPGVAAAERGGAPRTAPSATAGPSAPAAAPVPAPAPAPRPARLLPLLGILVLAVGIRAAGISSQSLTMDEITEVTMAAAPAGEIVVKADGFPPLYQLALRAWAPLGDLAETARWFSVAAGVLTVLVVFGFGLEIAGPAAALWAAALVAVSPLHVWYAQEARAYGLTLLFAALALWCFARAVRSNRAGDWLLYAAAALGGLYTHYYFALFVAAHGLWTLGWMLTRRRSAAPALLAHAALAIATLPLLVLLRGDLAFQSGMHFMPSTLANLPYTLYAFFLGFSTGLSIRELHSAGMGEALRGFLPWLVALAACALLLVPPLLRSMRDDVARTFYLVVMTVFPIVLCDLLAHALHLKYKVQYAAWGAIPLTLLLASAIARAPRRHATLAALALYATLAGVALANRHLVDRYRNEDAAALATYLERHSAPDVPVLVATGYMADPVRFYLGPEWAVRSLPDASRTDADARRILETVDRPFWVVYTRPFHGDPAGRLQHYLAGRPDMALAARFAGIDLYRRDGADAGRS